MLKEKDLKSKKKKNDFNILRPIISIYLIGVLIFLFFTIPTISINGGSKIGFKSLSAVKKNIASGNNIDLIGQGGDKLSIKSSDINYIARPVDGFKQRFYIWPIELILSPNKEVQVEASYDYEKLKDTILRSDLTNQGEAPVDAEIVFNEEKNEYEIKEEVFGTSIDVDKTLNHVVEKLDAGEFSLIDIKDQYKAPKVLSTDESLVVKRDNLNKIRDMKITYDLFNVKEELSGDRLADMYDSNSKGELVPNKERAREYLVDLAIKYDTFGSDRKFKAKDIGEITVPGGIYGWEISVNNSLDDLVQQLGKFESAELKPNYRIEGVYRDEYNDIGPTYVEVDIGRQHMWYFKDGQEVFNAEFVSGKDVDGRRTPLGVHQLWSKQKDTYLTGATWRSHVDYWMPIDWSGVGFHDAKWRGSFGGEIYKNSGSHGCLNMPPSKASEFYNMVELYTPVVVYDSTKL